MYKKFLILFFLAAFFGTLKSYSADIIFPQKNPYTTSSKTTYIAGCVKPGASLTINGNAVKVYPDGGFCLPVNLVSGENKFTVRESGQQPEILTVYAGTAVKNQGKPSVANNQTNSFIKYPSNKFALVKTDGAPVRTSHSVNSARLTHLPKDTAVFVSEKFGNWFKLDIKDGRHQFWISSSNVNVMYDINYNNVARFYDFCEEENENFKYFKIKTDIPVAFTVLETSYGLKAILYGAKADKSQYGKVSAVNDEYGNAILNYPLKTVMGYEGYYKDGYFTLKIRKPPIINHKYLLKNIKIVIDPGHGGSEKGTVGLTKVPEKNVNLDISLRLKEKLEREGATVIMTRTDDRFVGLYDRVNFARSKEPLICLSIHANSIVDGNPLIKHGTSAFYYHPQARNLAQIIKNNAVNDLGLKDDGCKFASFVLTRESMPVSVLFEVAYMPNPDENLLLTNSGFREKVAESLKNSLKDYILKYGDNTNKF